jgi:GDP-4-dehydro-6-deoxy-D-mannose reductase
MRFLITGISGFAARHLAERLVADGHEVFGTTRRVPAAASPIVPREHIAAVDLRDRDAVAGVVRSVRPAGVFHLAAVTDVAASISDPDETYRVNLFGSLHVFAAVRAEAPACRVVWIGSSHAYGAVDAADLPVTERQQFRPLSPYAASKAAADLAAYQWARAEGLQIVRLRPFNHTGPGQAPQFVCADFAKQVAEIERGVHPPRIDTGNLDVVRDFTDVRDVVRAYVLAWERGVPGEDYNVCSGTGRTPRQILDGLLRLSGVQAAVTVRPDRQRSVDVPALVGSPTKLRQATGWAPAISWDETLRDVLADWRRRIRKD